MRSWLSLGGLGVRIVESRAKSESGEKSKEEEREREWAEMRKLALTPYPIPRCLFSAHLFAPSPPGTGKAQSVPKCPNHQPPPPAPKGNRAKIIHAVRKWVWNSSDFSQSPTGKIATLAVFPTLYALENKAVLVLPRLVPMKRQTEMNNCKSISKRVLCFKPFL